MLRSPVKSLFNWYRPHLLGPSMLPFGPLPPWSQLNAL